MQKRCSKCRQYKPITLFYKHAEMADGYLNKCKLCVKRGVKERYNNPIQKKKIIEYEKKRWQNPERRKKALEYQRKRRNSFKGKNRCRQVVNNALRDGRLIRLPCEVCNNPKSQAHHPDYRSPLKVNWLCRKHHLEIEGKIPF